MNTMLKACKMATMFFVACCFFYTNSYCQKSRDISGFKIEKLFPGGDLLIERISADTVWIAPDTREILGDWFYWYFSVRTNSDRNIYFKFSRIGKIPSFGPALSTDAGKSWSWMFNTRKTTQEFSYSFKANQEVRFSMGFPYVKENFDVFITPYLQHKFVHLDTLCFTAKKRAVPLLTLENPERPPEIKIAITARHHACEMMASYVMEGIIDAIVRDPGLKTLRDKVSFKIVPFVDLDGVEDGDQGKNRIPHDHNRDYSGENLYASTKAIQQLLSSWGGDKIKVGLDLHCPGLVGKEHEVLHIVGSKNDRIAVEEDVFGSLLANRTKEGMRFRNDILKFGTYWNTPQNEKLGFSFSSWLQSQFPNIDLATTLEIPYASNKGDQVNIKDLRMLGRNLAYSIEDYLRKKNLL